MILKYKLLTLAYFSCLLPFFVFSQEISCSTLPVSCDEVSISQAHDSSRRLVNFLNVPQELRMENRCRTVVENAIQTFIEKNHWLAYQIKESSYSGPVVAIGNPRAAISSTDPRYNPDFLCGIKYEWRPPHFYDLQFMIVVNSDSLDMWRRWRIDTLSEKILSIADAITKDNIAAGDNPKLKSYSDSINYYITISTEFQSKNYSQYSKDLLADNKKGIKFYDDKREYFEKKMEYFRKKYDAEKEKSSSVSTESSNAFYYKNAKKDGLYIEGGSLLVTIIFNNTACSLTSDLYGPEGLYLRTIIANPPGAQHAFILRGRTFPVDAESQHYDFENASCIGTVLLGSWVLGTKGDSQDYTARYAINLAAMDASTLKKTACDVIQNIEVQVRGRKDYVENFINQFDFESLAKLTTR